MGLHEELSTYKYKDVYPMHMPGHKRNPAWMMNNPYEEDITEIDGFDNLNNPKGIIKDCMERAAAVYGSEDSYLLVNGATAGILAAMSAMTKSGDTILMMRNSHISVYNAAYINKLGIQYLYPDTIDGLGISGRITPLMVAKKLREHKEVSLVIITSPTYEGVISDIKGIAEAVHEFGIPLLVDSSHGAHLGFHPYFHENAAALADCVIHGIHKTLPAFTQTGLMHVNGGLVKQKEIKRYLSIYQTTSPSYILMSGIDRCINFLEENAEAEFERFAEFLKDFYDITENLENIGIYKPLAKDGIRMDPSKIMIYLKNNYMAGHRIYECLLNRYKIQPEMAGGSYTLCMTSVCDTKEGFERLIRAVSLIDKEKLVGSDMELPELRKIYKNPRVYHPFEAIGKTVKSMKLSRSAGEISAEYLYLYPPGIPLLVPGEVITDDMLLYIEIYKAAGFLMNGIEDIKAEHILVLDVKHTRS